jgi:23S rRNA (guanosine2251-2'-O)-methyltransferase
MSLTKIYGLHAAQAALDYSAEKIQQAWVAQDRKDQRLNTIHEALEKQGITVQKLSRRELDRLAGGKNHQSIIIEIILPKTLNESELQRAIQTSQKLLFFLVLDHVQDPHNLGACLRTAEAAGVQGIIITKDQAVGITPTVCKVACGAAEMVPVYQVTNLVRCLKWLKDQGLWIIGAAGEAEQSLYQTDLNIALALVIGAEEKGMRRLTREQCDLLVKLPMAGKVASLNLSVAAGVLMYEALRQRLFQ